MTHDILSAPFTWATGIEDTFIQHARPRLRPLDEYELTQHYKLWKSDIDLVAETGVQAVRWGIPWHIVQPAPDKWDWEWTDRALEHIVNVRGITPILDLMHYGTPLWLDNSFINASYPQRVAEYAAAVVARYKSLVHYYTPLNEPMVNANMSGYKAEWPPYLSGDDGYVKLALAIAKGMVLTTRAIKAEQPEAMTVQVEALWHTFTRDESLKARTALLNARQFLCFDLATGRVDHDHALSEYVHEHHAAESDLHWLRSHAVTFDILGANYYPWSYAELRPHPTGKPYTVVRRATGHKIELILRNAWERYHMPIMVTETSSNGDIKARAKWMDDTLDTIRSLRSEGIPVVGYTWFPLFTMVDWEYRKGRRTIDKYLQHLGLYDSAFDTEGVLRRQVTPLVKHYQEHMTRSMPPVSSPAFTSPAPSPRIRRSLDGQWYFSPTKILKMDDCPQITVPSPWQADARFRDHVGEAWYQREFEVPREWLDAGRVVMLGFGAVDYFAEVWLNDVKAGEHEGGYLPFELDITEAVRPGRNTLTVRVEDPLETFPEIPHGKQSWYGLLSGIWQSVWVESRAANHIQKIRISTKGGEVWVEVSGRGDFVDGLTAEILDPNDEMVARAEPDKPRFSLRVEQPLSWSPDEPRLYTLKLSTNSDEMTETFGFRTIEARDGQILLNGRPFYLRGALDQDYYPELISTPPSLEYIEDQFRKAKEMGLNCLRVHIKVADPRYYAAADKIGLLIWTELPNHILLSDEAKRRARETLAGMLERDGNHPSIGIWTIINESWGIDLTDPSQRGWLAETYDWLKELDPTRLVVGNSACWGNFHVATDIADFHIYYAMPDHYSQWRDWTETYARRPGWLFAHEYKDHATWQEFGRDPWRAVERSFAAEVHERGDEPLLVSEFGNWGLPDVTKLYEGNNDTVPWWFDTGLEWGDGVVYPRGVEQRFKAYHLDQVFPSLSALSEASQHLQYDALKYEIEQIRSYESIQGYVITEFTDVHWECNGLLDMVRNPKVYHSRLKEINADDVLIPLWERLAFSADETCEMGIIFSHYSAAEIKDAVLRWEVVGPELPLISDQLLVGQTVAYQVNELGVVRFDIPHVHRPTRTRLELRLVSGEKVITAAEQELYVFPSDVVLLSGVTQAATKMQRIDAVYSPKFHRRLEQLGFSTTDDLSRADVAVITKLDDACREFLLQGGRVLLLAEADDALQTYIPGIGIESRSGTPWQGDWASSFGWHRFESLPTDHVVNFAFADLTPEHVIHGFAPRDFALDVFAGLFVGWLQKPVPTIARRRVGRGTLLISTFRLSKNLETNSLAKYLLCELLEILA